MKDEIEIDCRAVQETGSSARHQSPDVRAVALLSDPCALVSHAGVDVMTVLTGSWMEHRSISK